ncbi:MAG TPA: hypothetical protein VEJ41_09700 [Candidatus Acidoferrales bacterium]|nr:hypothetical protein [Candidatus Acidoferrales bacterium]
MATLTSRYDALRAATVGRYGFDACVLPLRKQERAVLDAAEALLPKTRVGLVVEADTFDAARLPRGFALIPTADWSTHPFPTDWIAREPAPASEVADASDSTAIAPVLAPGAVDLGVAKRRLKSLAARAQRELGLAGFVDERLDPLAALEDEIAWASASASGFGILLAIVPTKAQAAPAALERTLGALRDLVKKVVRDSDAIAQGRESILVIVPEAREDDIAAVAARLAHRVRRTLKDPKVEKSLARALRHVTIGASAYPAHGLTRETLLARATAAAQPAT